MTSTFIFRRANGIFQILSLKSVFLGPILYLVRFFVEVLLQIETSSIIKNLAETFLPISLGNLFHVLIHSKIFKLKKHPFPIIRIRGVIPIPL